MDHLDPLAAEDFVEGGGEPGSAGIIAIYEHDGADTVAGALTNAIRSSTVQIDKASAEELKAALKKASAGLAG